MPADINRNYHFQKQTTSKHKLTWIPEHGNIRQEGNSVKEWSQVQRIVRCWGILVRPQIFLFTHFQ